MRWFQDYWLCRLCTLHLPTNIQNQISEQFYLHLSIHFRPILHRQMCPLTDRQEFNTLCPSCVMNSTILFSKWRSHYQNIYLEHGKVSHLDARILHYRLPLLPPLPPYAKWQGFKRAFHGNAAFDLAAATGQIPVSSPQSAVRSPQLLVLWWQRCEHCSMGAYWKCIIIFGKLEEKSIFGRNSRWPSHFKPQSAV